VEELNDDVSVNEEHEAAAETDEMSVAPAATKRSSSGRYVCICNKTDVCT